ncbi:MAG: N-acetylmuramoyl-L-alanine amidase [Chloroflexota bacterium]
MTRRLLAALLAVALLALAWAPAATAANDTIAAFRVIASPFTSDDVSTRHAAGIRLKLSRRARVTITIEQTGGAIVRHVASGGSLAKGGHRWSWKGRNDAGAFVPDGNYLAHLVVTNSLGTDSRTLPVRKGMPPIFPANPGAITVLVNPGHGASYNGAISQGLYEKEVNLSVGLRLRRLLEAAGVNVVMTRTTDTHVNLPQVDVNGDGLTGPKKPGGQDFDELAARIDIGNEARADIHVFNHNNAAGCKCIRGTEVFTGYESPWAPEGIDLATFIQQAQLAQLDTFRSSSYYPLDRGVKPGDYYTVSPYNLNAADPPLLPRPTLMATVLTETLFVNDPIERELLRRSDVREAIAIALYLGIADYFAARDFGIRYELVSGPTALAPNGTADYRLRVTNTGNLTSSGWQLRLGSVAGVPHYDGSGAIGDLMGSAVIPNGLAPGASTEIVVHATAPSSVGEWLVKADVSIGGSDRPYLSERGVVPLQLPLTTT